MPEIELIGGKAASVVRLLSTPGVNVVGLVAWARSGYATELQRGQPVAPFLAVLAEGYGLGTVIAERVLRGETKAVVEGEEIVLHLNGEEAHLFEACREVCHGDNKLVTGAHGSAGPDPGVFAMR